MAVMLRRFDGDEPDPADLEQGLRSEGLAPSRWGNAPDAVYQPHRHAYTKVLVCLEGSITFHVTGHGDVALEPGDRLELAAEIEHGATVGPRGVECVEARAD